MLDLMVKVHFSVESLCRLFEKSVQKRKGEKTSQMAYVMLTVKHSDTLFFEVFFLHPIVFKVITPSSGLSVIPE